MKYNNETTDFPLILPFALGRLPDWLIEKNDSPVSLVSNTENNTLILEKPYEILSL